MTRKIDLIEKKMITDLESAQKSSLETAKKFSASEKNFQTLTSVI